MKKCLISTLLALSIGATALFGLSGFKSVNANICVNIYYDESKDSTYWMGKTYAMLVQNLMGHFPEFQQIVSPIELYQSGDIEKCQASIYIGSYFDNAIPPVFFDDFVKTQKHVAWLGYNIWNFGPERLDQMFGYQYVSLTTLNQDILDNKSQPTFFKDVLYKGEVFFKYGQFKKEEPKTFLSSFEMVRLKNGTNNGTQVLAQARHNGTQELLPYALRNKNKFYIADVPFSYMHEADRYMVFCDLLFDILGAAPKHEGKYAFLRIEDIHPLVPVSYLQDALKALSTEQVPAHISLIPIFFDPLNEYSRDTDQEFVTLSQVPEFMQFLSEVKKQKGVIIWHGSTHQLGEMRNPHTGVSGDDFEFWDANNNRILPQDSSDFVLDRLDSGFYDLQKAGIAPQLWLTPHYQASPLDYLIFARVFPWNVGRVIYFNHHLNSMPSITDEKDFWYSAANNNPAAQKRRIETFKKIDVTVESDRWSGQIFPYEILGDVYGQRIIPENLGNSQPIENSYVVQPRSVQEMIADAKRNLVIRDVWGSFFYHVQLFNIDENGGRGRYPGDASELIYLIKELKKLGYQFINLDEFISQHTDAIRPEPIYRKQQVTP